MKQSRRNIRNAIARAERRAQGKPALSKYERKLGREVGRIPPAEQPRGIDTPQREDV